MVRQTCKGAKDQDNCLISMIHVLQDLADTCLDVTDLLKVCSCARACACLEVFAELRCVQGWVAWVIGLNHFLLSQALCGRELLGSQQLKISSRVGCEALLIRMQMCRDVCVETFQGRVGKWTAI